MAVVRFGVRGDGRPRSWCLKCDATYARERTAAEPGLIRRRKAATERRRRADPITGPQLREAQRHFHRFRGSTPTDRAYAAILKGDPCSYCGRRPTEVDHIEPCAKGGTDEWSNLTAACRSCNAQKNDRPLLWWIGRRILEAEAMTENAA